MSEWDVYEITTGYPDSDDNDHLHTLTAPNLLQASFKAGQRMGLVGKVGHIVKSWRKMHVEVTGGWSA